MILHLIKLEHGMAQVILGVNNATGRSPLSYYSLTAQIIIVNLFTAIIGLVFLILFNYFLLTNNKKIEINTDQINLLTNDIAGYLQKNAVIRIPQFNEENCERLTILDTKNILSMQELESLGFTYDNVGRRTSE